MLLQKNILTQKSASLSSKLPTSPPLVPSTQKTVGKSESISEKRHGISKIRRKKVRRINLETDSPIKQTRQPVDPELYSESDDGEDIIWGSPSKKRPFSDDQAYAFLCVLSLGSIA